MERQLGVARARLAAEPSPSASPLASGGDDLPTLGQPAAIGSLAGLLRPDVGSDLQRALMLLGSLVGGEAPSPLGAAASVGASGPVSSAPPAAAPTCPFGGGGAGMDGNLGASRIAAPPLPAGGLPQAGVFQRGGGVSSASGQHVGRDLFPVRGPQSGVFCPLRGRLPTRSSPMDCA